jgi:GNAT superfamily N-acetyltransferase
MSLWSEYIREREGHEVIEEGWGFIEYSVAAPVCMIHSIYIREDRRNEGLASQLADRVAEIGRDQGCNLLWSQVWAKALNASSSLRAILAYGFSVREAQGDCIILTKNI